MSDQGLYTQQSGFTLIEVMAALAIVAFGITAAVSIVSSIGLNTVRLEEKVYAQWVLSNVAVEIQLKQLEKARPAPFPTTATVEMGGREWYLFAKNTAASLPNTVLTTVDICLDQQKQDCVLEQGIFSSHKTLPSPAK